MSESGQALPKELSGTIGKYTIIKPLGKGAMGMVYLAHDEVLEREVALKVMMPQIADDEELMGRFKREAKAVAKMSHPNVVMVFDLGSHTDGSPYIAMELLKGQDLQKAMRSPDMNLERKVNVIIQVLQGLAHAHQAGIVHRDIKPANIFIGVDGAVKIMDFGVARLTTASMTGTGNIVGTADYMSPEQVKGAKVDGRSDLFSVGCMLFELLAGRRPFHSENLMAIFYKITHEEPNFELIPQDPECQALMPILRKALAKQLDERYQTAYEFAGDLKGFLKHLAADSSQPQHALEGLIDMEQPASMPAPIDDSAGPTLLSEGDVIDIDDGHGATMEISQAQTQRGTGTRAPAATVVGGGTRAGATAVTPATQVQGVQPTRVLPGQQARGTTAAGRPTVVVQPPPLPRPRPAPQPSGNPVLYTVLGVLGTAVVVLVGYVIVAGPKPTPAPPPPTQASVPVSVATPPPATTQPTPPPTPAPQPTFEAKGRASAALRSAQAAFKSGDYDRAIKEAQGALREDPGNSDATRLVENALQGQKAEAHLKAGESALKAGDYDKALSEAEAGRSIAPWDGRVTALIGRVSDAKAAAQASAAQQKAAAQQAQVNQMLTQADNAFQAQKYDAAITLYDEVLKLDASNQRAGIGKANALGAKAMSQAAATGPRPGGGKAFVAGKTQASSAETRSGNLPEGFEESAGVQVKKGTQAAELPGKLNLDVEPQAVKPGEKYTIKVSLRNEGSAPIAIKEMIITTKVNGRSVSGPVSPNVKEVAPQQSAQLLALPDFWKEDTTSWSMEVLVRTPRGETYKNSVTWK